MWNHHRKLKARISETASFPAVNINLLFSSSLPLFLSYHFSWKNTLFEVWQNPALVSQEHCAHLHTHTHTHTHKHSQRCVEANAIETLALSLFLISLSCYIVFMFVCEVPVLKWILYPSRLLWDLSSIVFSFFSAKLSPWVCFNVSSPDLSAEGFGCSGGRWGSHLLGSNLCLISKQMQNWDVIL